MRIIRLSRHLHDRRERIKGDFGNGNLNVDSIWAKSAFVISQSDTLDLGIIEFT
jgi:hypothetical protein